MDYQHYADQLAKLSDDKLIIRFNDDVGHSGWVSARANFLAAMRQELLKRFDCSNVIKGGGMSMKYKIRFKNEKLFQMI